MSVAEQLAKQYHERMNRPSLAEMVREAYAKYAPIAVSGLPRRAMPQLKGSKAAKFLAWLKDKSIATSESTVMPCDLMPSQRELDQAKVDSIAANLDGEWEGPPPIVAADGSILDGHHRWAAHCKSAPRQSIPVVRVNVGIGTLLDLAWEWQDGESDLVERFSRVYADLGYPVYRPTPSIREMVLRAYHGHVERYAKFREDEHPRGQPENAGQFVAKDESGSAAKEPTKKEQAKQKADAAFEALMKDKSADDAEAFRRARADGIAIPPAWTEVVYYGKDKDIFVEGRDAKGRKQRAENPAYRQRISDENNARIAKDLMPRINDLREQLRKDAMDGDEESKVLYLISLTGFRIGGKGDGKAKTQAFGASTLTGDHVKVDGNTATFDFPGKKGVRQQHSVTDPVIADMVRNAKPGEPIFATRDAKVRTAWQERYGGAKVHDIRHVVATEMAEADLSKRIPPPPKNESERKKIIKEVATVAAGKLGNNPSQALGTYIDPGIWKKVQVAK